MSPTSEDDIPPPPFDLSEVKEIDGFVERLVPLVGGKHNLNAAVYSAYDQAVDQMRRWGIIDGNSFLKYATAMLKWVPTEIHQGNLVYNTLCMFYFILNQHPIKDLQSSINPDSIDAPLSSVSQWIVTYANKVGDWMDTTASLTKESLQSFYDSPNYHLEEAIVPEDPEDPENPGFRTFNQLFTRHLKPGSRPISGDDKVITWPADSTFDGSWNVEGDGDVIFCKGIEWPVKDLLQNSSYAKNFENGQWMHAFLGPGDYHRQHAPVSGDVLEAKVIQGQAYLEVEVKDGKAGKYVQPRRSYRSTYISKTIDNPASKQPERDPHAMDAPNSAGYQFLQTRGCIIIENPTVGLVAVLPIGMCQVSSVNLSVQGIHDTGPLPYQVKKGDEISWFEFGGSDIVLVFQATPRVDLSKLKIGTHYNVGNELGTITG